MVATSFLSRIPLFSEVSASEMKTLSRGLCERRYARGAVIFPQGDSGSSLFIIVSGLVKIVRLSPDGKEKTLVLLGPGEFFGELSLLDEEPRSAGAVAVETSHLYIFERKPFLAFLKANPDVFLKLVSILCRRLRHTDEIVQDTAFLDIPGRLAKTILALAESQGKPAEDGIAIGPRMSQTELATLVGATRESINKWLGFYESEGLLRFGRGRITVLDMKRLRLAAQLRAGEIP